MMTKPMERQKVYDEAKEVWKHESVQRRKELTNGMKLRRESVPFSEPRKKWSSNCRKINNIYKGVQRLVEKEEVKKLPRDEDKACLLMCMRSILNKLISDECPIRKLTTTLESEICCPYAIKRLAKLMKKNQRTDARDLIKSRMVCELFKLCVYTVCCDRTEDNDRQFADNSHFCGNFTNELFISSLKTKWKGLLFEVICYDYFHMPDSWVVDRGSAKIFYENTVVGFYDLLKPEGQIYLPLSDYFIDGFYEHKTILLPLYDITLLGGLELKQNILWAATQQITAQDMRNVYGMSINQEDDLKVHMSSKSEELKHFIGTLTRVTEGCSLEACKFIKLTKR